MTALLELKDIRRSYPSGDGPVEVQRHLPSGGGGRDGGDCRGIGLR
jgi:hypothetical protein